jgi:hypothetical protein
VCCERTLAVLRLAFAVTLVLAVLTLAPDSGSGSNASTGSSSASGLTAVDGALGVPLVANTLLSVEPALRAAVSSSLGGEQRRFAVVSRHGLFVTRGGVRTVFGARGPVLRVGKAVVSLRLGGLGYGRSLRAVGTGTRSADANRVRYRRRGVVEWYRNGPRGLEQGFTLTRRPSAGRGPLTVAIVTVGGAVPRRSGSSVVFGGPRVCRYGGLQARDAAGRTLPARLELAGRTIRLRVNDRRARYPLTIDPLIEQAKLTGGGEVGPGRFGVSVALSADGNTALIAGHLDNGGVGAAWVFTRAGGTWSQQGAKLTANDENGSGQFGFSVALSADGNTALIGGPDDNNVPFAGAAWVFTRAGTSWSQQGTKLTASDANPVYGANFGTSVALSADGNTALIGGPRESGIVGAAWVFTRAGTTWSQQGPKLTANDQNGTGRFGWSVALSADGNTALVGNYFDNAAVGAAVVFTRAGTTWSQQGPKLTASGETGAGEFGLSVALSADGTTALIGGYRDNGDVGAAWVFTRTGASWSQQGARLTAGDENGPGRFGDSVALSADGNTALIGGYRDNGSVGAAWLFTRAGATWSQQGAKLAPKDENGSAEFGSGVALSADGRTALVGGWSDNGLAGASWMFAYKLSQTISFDPLAPKTYGDPDFPVSAAASSGLTVSFAASGNCAVSGGNTVHLTGAGSCTVTASQPGDANYDAAPEVPRTFSIARATCTVPNVVGKTLGAAKSRIASSHCRTGKVAHAYSRTRKKGIVISQSRRPGVVVPAESTVDLVVSRGRR